MMTPVSAPKGMSTAKPGEGVSHLMQLPAEIILLISDHLPDLEALCLALTCKSLLFLLGDKVSMSLEPGAKMVLLCRLEKEVIGVLYCY
ncbi:hypothetical protein F4677DRAFT_408745 [Hypoxylon crocopeplum]|nr:hypothetical protein F4677DRAFT_408745 [Hypoxylon crocopeplum]